jgi:SAM-dependent methyltransferase
MCLHDFDDMIAAVAEAARILSPDGRFAIALLHPVFTTRLTGTYADEQPYSLTLDRAGQAMTYHGRHRPITAYTTALAAAGLAIEMIREPLKTNSGKNTMPFLHLLARRSTRSPGESTRFFPAVAYGADSGPAVLQPPGSTVATWASSRASPDLGRHWA